MEEPQKPELKKSKDSMPPETVRVPSLDVVFAWTWRVVISLLIIGAIIWTVITIIRWIIETTAIK